jgi:hypothetical protein
MKTRFTLLSVSILGASAFFGILSASAAVQTSIKIEQVSPKKVGTWTMLFADGSSKASTESGASLSTTFSVTIFDQMTLSVVPLPGMSVKIAIYRNGDLVKTETTPQYSFKPLPNESYRFVISYAYTRMGSLGVTSDPSSLRFRMKGPAGTRMFTAKSPFTFNQLPAGKYTLYFPAHGKCAQPAPHGATIEPGKRNTVHITLNCSVTTTETVDNSRVSKRTLVEQAKAREYKKRGERK